MSSGPPKKSSRRTRTGESRSCLSSRWKQGLEKDKGLPSPSGIRWPPLPLLAPSPPFLFLLKDVLDLNLAVQMVILGDAVVALRVLALPNHLRKLLVVRDHQQLEVLLPAPLLHDPQQGGCKALRIRGVQVGGGLVQRQDPAVQAEGLCQRQADDQRCQHFLSGAAAAPHVQLRVPAAHHHLVVVGARAHPLGIGSNLYMVNVLAAVGLLPELLDDLVDLLHLEGVEAHEGPVQSIVVLVQILVGHLGRLQLDELIAEAPVDVAVLRRLELRLVPRHVALVCGQGALAAVLLCTPALHLAPPGLQLPLHARRVAPHRDHLLLQRTDLRRQRLHLAAGAAVLQVVVNVALHQRLLLEELLVVGQRSGQLGQALLVASTQGLRLRNALQDLLELRTLARLEVAANPLRTSNEMNTRGTVSNFQQAPLGRQCRKGEEPIRGAEMW
eukprot:TRINITY_DN22081_c0_g1_i1.p1 TRINITY_DN22081_c0_g1~~TRINITY_DN22081_c0_g1_i1.p1  ORF type:complete len:442 (-),score=75.19 TRINITY_DN22081_c0_g1_i1:430-1755(-)